MSCNNKAFAFGMGLIAGVVGGIVAGILYAPKSGEESRRELKEAAEKLYEKHAPAIQEAKQQAAEAIEITKYKLERQFKKINSAIKSDKMLKAKEAEAH
jgi:gas vesicle protein